MPLVSEMTIYMWYRINILYYFPEKHAKYQRRYKHKRQKLIIIICKMIASLKIKVVDAWFIVYCYFFFWHGIILFYSLFFLNLRLLTKINFKKYFIYYHMVLNEIFVRKKNNEKVVTSRIFRFIIKNEIYYHNSWKKISSCIFISVIYILYHNCACQI